MSFDTFQSVVYWVQCHPAMFPSISAGPYGMDEATAGLVGSAAGGMIEWSHDGVPELHCSVCRGALDLTGVEEAGPHNCVFPFSA